MFISTTQVRVRYGETDKMNVVYHGNYVEYFEVGRVEAIRALGITYKEMEEGGVIMPVIDWQARSSDPPATTICSPSKRPSANYPWGTASRSTRKCTMRGESSSPPARYCCTL